MSLERFMTSRLVVLTPSTRLYDAARAMEDNGVGAVGCDEMNAPDRELDGDRDRLWSVELLHHPTHPV